MVCWTIPHLVRWYFPFKLSFRDFPASQPSSMVGSSYIISPLNPHYILMKAPLIPHLVRWFPNQEWNSPGLGTCCVWDAGPCAALPAGATPEGVPSTWGATVDVPKRRVVIAQNSNSDRGKKMALLPNEWSLDVFLWIYMCLLVFHFYRNDVLMMKYEILGLLEKVQGMCSESGQMFSDLKTNLINHDTKTDWLINHCKVPKFPG